MYGFAPADYTMNGSPGGLERIDNLFGTNLYTSSFSASPVVFGAFPSLHAGWATLHSLYIHHLFPRARVLLCAYVMWVWWATMYLTHHYFIDLIGGSCLAVTVFYIAERNYLPQVQPENLFRWHYESRDSISATTRVSPSLPTASLRAARAPCDYRLGVPTPAARPNSHEPIIASRRPARIPD